MERANQTLQDRLVKEMRLAGINNMAEANAWLPAYIADYNRRFAVVPKDPHDAHLPYQGTAEELTRTLSVQVIKTLSKNLSCQLPWRIDTGRNQRYRIGHARSRRDTAPTL